MKSFLTFVGVMLLSMFFVNVIAWSKGNSMEYTVKNEVLAPASEAAEPSADKDYYWKLSLIEKVEPSNVPGFWTRTTDTLSRELISKNK